MKGLTQSEWKAQRVHVEEPRLCAVFINTEHAQVRRKVYRYSDGLRPLQDGSYEIMYNGTKTGKNDEHLLEAIENHYPFKIYMRKKSDSFKYLVSLLMLAFTNIARKISIWLSVWSYEI